MKVAIATTSEYEAMEFRKLLFKKYKVTEAEETHKDGLYTSVFTTSEADWESMLKMFDMIHTITGINPYTHKKTKERVVVKAKTIAAVLLRRKYGLTTTIIAGILKYKDHASIVQNTKGIEIGHIKHLPLELIIRNIRQQFHRQFVKNTDIQVQQ
ncbi:MAG: hypothetical protein ACYS1A_17720 [Planctomycetota bacterium]